MEGTKTHWKVIIDNNYFGAYSFNDKVNEVTVTIKKTEAKTVFNPQKNQEEPRRVMYFEEENVDGIEIKPWIINNTNCERIEELYGSGFVEDWVGKRITLFKTTTKVGGEVTDCVRVKAQLPPFKAKAKVYKCSVCGKEITEQIYNGSIKKYGAAVCSKECVEKLNQNIENKEENN